MTCLVCQQSLTTEYQLVGIEQGTWRSLYACPGMCAEQARQGADAQESPVSSQEEQAA